MIACLLSLGVEANAQWQQRADWAATFDQAGAAGTIAVLDLRGGEDRRLAHNARRAQQRFSPASTFKVPHALFALDAGVVRDEFQVFEWDGEKRWMEAWNRDQDLRSSMRNSVVWVYQHFAREIGEAREREYMETIDYGNADPSGGIDRFWIEGDLKISPIEQIEFLRRLYYNELPFAVKGPRNNNFRFSHPIGTPPAAAPRSRNPQRRPCYACGFAWSSQPHPTHHWARKLGSYFCAGPKHQRLVKDLMINETANEWTREWILRAKTGWSTSSEPGIGWWVGWVEWPEGPVFFALNIDMPNGIDDTPKRKSIAQEVLRSIDALPKHQ